MQKYRKSITAVVGGVLVTLTDLGVDQVWLTAIVAVATALGVYAVPNEDA